MTTKEQADHENLRLILIVYPINIAITQNS